MPAVHPIPEQMAAVPILGGTETGQLSSASASYGRERTIEGLPEPTGEGILPRRAQYPPWTDKRMTIHSVNSRAALEYLSSGRGRRRHGVAARTIKPVCPLASVCRRRPG